MPVHIPGRFWQASQSLNINLNYSLYIILCTLTWDSCHFWKWQNTKSSLWTLNFVTLHAMEFLNFIKWHYFLRALVCLRTIQFNQLSSMIKTKPTLTFTKLHLSENIYHTFTGLSHSKGLGFDSVIQIQASASMIHYTPVTKLLAIHYGMHKI